MNQHNFCASSRPPAFPRPSRAVNYLEDFQNISMELDDLEGQGRAYEALAAVYQVRSIMWNGVR